MTDTGPAEHAPVTWTRQQLRLRNARINTLLLDELHVAAEHADQPPDRPGAEPEAGQ